MTVAPVEVIELISHVSIQGLHPLEAAFKDACITAGRLSCPLSKAPSNVSFHPQRSEGSKRADPLRPNLSQDSLLFHD